MTDHQLTLVMLNAWIAVALFVPAREGWVAIVCATIWAVGSR